LFQRNCCRPAIDQRYEKFEYGTKLCDASLKNGFFYAMNENIKPVESLTVADLQAHPVWEWLNDDEIGDTMMEPVEELPVTTGW
jgi:hypothetical protein